MQGILLAAGRARRFGADKLLCPLADGTPVALAAGRNLVAALPGALAVVNGDGPLAEALAGIGLRVSVCPHADAGMGHSLAWAVAQSPGADGWLVALADMPVIAPATLRAVAAGVRGELAIAAPVYAGRRGHPVAFGRGHGKALAGLCGDTGARALLEVHAGELRLLPCDDPGVLLDIDLPGHLAALGGAPLPVAAGRLPASDQETLRAELP